MRCINVTLNITTHYKRPHPKNSAKQTELFLMKEFRNEKQIFPAVNHGHALENTVGQTFTN